MIMMRTVLCVMLLALCCTCSFVLATTEPQVAVSEPEGGGLRGSGERAGLGDSGDGKGGPGEVEETSKQCVGENNKEEFCKANSSQKVPPEDTQKHGKKPETVALPPPETSVERSPTSLPGSSVSVSPASSSLRTTKDLPHQQEESEEGMKENLPVQKVRESEVQAAGDGPKEQPSNEQNTVNPGATQHHDGSDQVSENAQSFTKETAAQGENEADNSNASTTQGGTDTPSDLVNGTAPEGSESTSNQESDVRNTENSTTTTTTTTTTTLPPELTNNKKGDADSSSSISSSVWVRVPLLIVVTLACILVC
ncbi:uncharacterized protein TM35_000511260 [Trypanosoma theileri]|uniref:Mucin-associated surface protein (MASP) n=1 Tax=Trypanosoma theileri TaxID=67003 RepID=A0A1X0NH26_9TRYP|nr:uncharacterized protein TM35_000511260 [Trypanosoma theileri]ORC84025.1 hypothetical protein TM35_000511260 [Trypanosoma theileri]